jgi:UDP-glucuronate 4-epimerase
VTVLVTGVAGFIGFHVARALLDGGERVVGVDDLNSYYDVRLKRARLVELGRRPAFCFYRLDIADAQAMMTLAAAEPAIRGIVHLAAQAGVRHSLTAPFAYAAANMVGHLAVLELARRLRRLRHLVYASSSSVYGANTALPFAETDRVETPLSLYAASKRADELMSHAYGHLFGVPQTGLRFFTVYGPWGRPDMAYFSFAEAILEGREITLYDGGQLRRDFTYIDDAVAGVLGCLARPPAGEASRPPVRIVNIGNRQPQSVTALIGLLEAALGRQAVVREEPRPLADAIETCAATEAIAALAGFAPRTPLAEGIRRFTGWLGWWRRERAKRGVDRLGGGA